MKYYLASTNSYPDGPEAGDGEPLTVSLTYDRPGLFPRDWASGQRFQRPPPEPVEASIEHANGRLLDYQDSPALIVSAALHHLLVEAQVTSVDWYALRLTNEATGQQRDDFFIGNVLRAVPTDHARHRTGPYAGLNMFQTLQKLEEVIDGAQLFRMAEARSQIVVHQAVYDLVRERMPKAIRFERVNFAI